MCLTDVDVPVEKIHLKHDWPGWWSKLEVFRVITGPALYLDLDTVITGSLDELVTQPHFAMLQNFHGHDIGGAGVMWFNGPVKGVYERFVEDPERVINYYRNHAEGSYRGDQGFINDFLGDVPRVSHPSIRSYKKHCLKGLPENTSMVVFHGKPRPTEINPPWMKEHWR